MAKPNLVLICVIVVGLTVAGSVALILRWSRAEKEAITAVPVEAQRESPNQMLAKQFLDSAKKAIVAGVLEDAEKKLDELEALCAGDPTLQEFNTTAAQVRAEIADLRQKAEAAFFKGRAELHKAAIEAAGAEIEKLSNGHVRHDLIAEQLIKSAPEGIWYRSLVPRVDNKPSQFYSAPLGGTRITVNIAGYSEDSTPNEMCNKITELLNNIRSEFGIPKDGEPPLAAGAPNWGFNTSLNARFDSPRLLSTIQLAGPFIPPSMTPLQKKVFKSTSKPLDFALRLSFELRSGTTTK